MNNVDTAIKRYYDLKGEYKRKYDNKKNKIIRNNDYSIREKRERIKNISMKCVTCKGNSGSTFNRLGNILTAGCGDKKNPCALSIYIDLGEYSNIFILLKDLEKDLEYIKTNILTTKLSLLHGLIQDDDAIETLDEMKIFYKKYSASSKELYKELDNKLKIPGDAGIKDITYQKQYIEESGIRIEELINRFKGLVGDIKDDGNVGILDEPMELYIKELKPLVTKRRELGYTINKIISEENFSINKNVVYEHRLIQTNHHINKYEIDIIPATIISNNIDNVDKGDSSDESIDRND